MMNRADCLHKGRSHYLLNTVLGHAVMERGADYRETSYMM